MRIMHSMLTKPGYDKHFVRHHRLPAPQRVSILHPAGLRASSFVVAGIYCSSELLGSMPFDSRNFNMWPNSENFVYTMISSSHAQYPQRQHR